MRLTCKNLNIQDTIARNYNNIILKHDKITYITILQFKVAIKIIDYV